MAGQIADMQSAGGLQASYSGSHSTDIATRNYENVGKINSNTRIAIMGR